MCDILIYILVYNPGICQDIQEATKETWYIFGEYKNVEALLVFAEQKPNSNSFPIFWYMVDLRGSHVKYFYPGT